VKLNKGGRSTPSPRLTGVLTLVITNDVSGYNVEPTAKGVAFSVATKTIDAHDHLAKNLLYEVCGVIRTRIRLPTPRVDKWAVQLDEIAPRRRISTSQSGDQA
jgi:hypothetical protein